MSQNMEYGLVKMIEPPKLIAKEGAVNIIKIKNKATDENICNTL